MVILTINSFDTYKAVIHGDLAKGFKALYRASCTAGDLAAAQAVVRKNFGEAAVSSIHRVEAADEIQRLCGDKAKGKAVWTFSQQSAGKPKSHLAKLNDERKAEREKWEPVRETLQKVQALGKAFLFGQAWLGWQLSALKAEHGVGKGRPGATGYMPWPELVARETGLPRRTADHFIKLFEAAQKKIKRLKKTGAKEALAIFANANPLSVPEEQRAELQNIIASVCDGETQASLMQELAIIPGKAKPPETSGGARQKKFVSAYQTSFAFFEPLALTFATFRTTPEADALLAGLPEFPSDECPLALSVLEQDARDLLARIEKLRKESKKAKKAGTVVDV